MAGAVAAGGAAALWKYGLGGRGGPRKPNVLLVVLDTARAHSFTCYGLDRPTSPRLDELCTQGTLYRKAFSTDFWTLPSHASLLTGLYPTETQATSETNFLPAGIPTLAERLQAHGYRTGAIVRNPWVSQERGFNKGFQDFVDIWRIQELSKFDMTDRQAEQGAVDASIAWMTRENPSAPFFHFLNLNIAHMPYDPQADIRKRFLTQQCPPDQLDRLMDVKGMWSHLAGALELSETDLRIMRELYEAEIFLADDFVGQLVDALVESKILDDTVVIVTSDHGENIGEHGMIDHLLSMYDTTLHVPLIVRYPERFQSGSISDDLISLIDIAPTVLDVCGVPEEDCEYHGRWGSLCNPERLKRDFVVAENDRPVNGVKLLNAQFPEFDTEAINCPIRTIRTHQHKLIWHVDKRVELYDLENDPAELDDVAASEPEVRDELLAQLKEWMASVAVERKAEMFQSQDSETIRQLRSLGYAR